jgi:ATP-dependent Clp protease protease subunit
MKVNAATGEGELYLYGDISSVSWWGDEITPQTFKQDLDALGDIAVLNVFINSNGGDVFAGHAIHSMLKRHKAKVVITVDGLAASIASVICTAGDVVQMYRNTMQMVHEPWTFAVGNASDMRKMADDLDKISESLVSAYEDKTGLSRDEIKAIMAAETWLTADECKEKGFCDVVLAEKKVAASISGDILAMNGQNFDISRFRNRPQIEVVDELPTTTPIVEDELPSATFASVDDHVEVVINGQHVGKFTVTDELRAILAKGRVLSAENEDHIRNAHDALGKVLEKLASDDGDADDKMDPNDPDHDPMHEPDGDPDDKCDPTKDALDALAAQVKTLTDTVAAMQASIPNAPQVMQNVEKPSPVEGEDIVVTPDDHVIVLEDAADEVDIEADTVKQTVKAALDEMKAELQEQQAEWKLKNLGRVD